MTISFVIFDMDDVLYDRDLSVRLDALSRISGKTGAEIQREIFQSGFEDRAEAGEPDTAEAYLSEFARLLGAPIDFRTWADIRKAMMRPNPQVLSMASRVAEVVDTILLTNNSMMLKEALPHCAPEAIDIFGEMAHVSAEFGARKPEPEVYLRVCERYGHAPKETLFIDDSEKNIEGAAAAGMQVHHYTDAGLLKAALQDLGLL